MAMCATTTSMAIRAPGARRIDSYKPSHASVPAPAARRAGVRTRDVRRPAWLGEWMKDNFGGDEKAKGDADGPGSAKPKKAGLDPDLFANAERVGVVPASRERAGAAGGRSASQKEQVQKQRSEAAAARARREGQGSKTPAFDELTPDELRPDFGLRRDLYVA